VEQQILELVGIVREGLPVVAEQAVNLKLIHESVFLVAATLAAVVFTVMVFKCMKAKKAIDEENAKGGYYSYLSSNGEAVNICTILFAVFAFLAWIGVFGAIATIIGIIACPDYYAVKEVLRLIPGAK